MTDIYDNIEKRTGGDIYIGIVGPVRSGKSTFIKKFMETLIIPNIADEEIKMRTIDELPQSAAGRTVMTTQPAYIPRQGVKIQLNGNNNLRVRLVDCVGYMIPDARGDTEDGAPRMVKTPWHRQAVPFEKAARIGTRKVITDHSTIGIVVTTDGTVCGISRENYIRAEDMVINQLKKLAKPFVVVLNSATPDSLATRKIADEITGKHGVPVVVADCTRIDKEKIEEILFAMLTGFPIKEIKISFPKWLAMQQKDFRPKEKIIALLKEKFSATDRISRIENTVRSLSECKYITAVSCAGIDYGTGCVRLDMTVDREIYYDTLQSITGTDVKDDWALMQLMQQLMDAKKQYDIIAPALRQVEATGYGIVMPSVDKLRLEEPEMVKQGSRYGIRLTASAPSMHILKADITTTVSPIIGNESSGEDMVQSMMKNFENNPLEIWQSNLLGNSLQELVNQGLNAKLLNIPADARSKLVETVERVVNEGCQGLICVIL
ncbi:MAG: stage IV sporulation protein A [Oscillospiraceae bacterium]|nr:stage IV sporulation protein A [Oscillospiraceae bacterium]